MHYRGTSLTLGGETLHSRQGVLGAFFFTLAFGLLFPTIVVALVYEKVNPLRNPS